MSEIGFTGSYYADPLVVIHKATQNIEGSIFSTRHVFTGRRRSV